MTGKKRGAASTLRKVLSVAKGAGISPVLIGAGALSAYGAPRYSEDIDFLLSSRNANRLVRVLLDVGFKGPPPSSDIYFYPLASPDGMQVDILGATDPLPLAAIRSARRATFLGVDVRVPSLEFFVLLKLLAADGDQARALRHLGDIQDLRRVRPEVDLDAVRAHVRDSEPALAQVLRKLSAGGKKGR